MVHGQKGFQYRVLISKRAHLWELIETGGAEGDRDPRLAHADEDKPGLSELLKNMVESVTRQTGLYRRALRTCG